MSANRSLNLTFRHCLSFQRAFLSTLPKKLNYEHSSVDQKSHTAKPWSPDDYRRVRFLGKEKLINPHFAIDMIAEEPIVLVEDNRQIIFSDSGNKLGHPRVYLNLERGQLQTCGYSGVRFIHKSAYKSDEHGECTITYKDYLRQFYSDWEVDQILLF
ncbi:hypothetical protein SNEBB_009747 [Seison nebaliae]|nr:hypothetical protein SNEBB_009747 [Seison nebaliae]